MTKEKLLKLLQEQADNSDYEVAHSLADEAICDFLKAQGHEDIVEVYDLIGKWYA